MTRLATNLKSLRKQKGLTQEQFSNKIGIKRSLVGAYEEARANPPLETLQNIAIFYKLKIEDLLHADFSRDTEQKIIRKTQANILKDIEGRGLRILPVIVDKDNNELITVINTKAAAGYLNGYSDPEYIEALPNFSLPMMHGQKTRRVFQIKGDSMLPITSGSYIITEYVENWQSAKDDKTYIIITTNEGIVYKRIENEVKDKKQLLLKSDNKEFEPYTLSIDNVLEIWEAVGFMSFEMPSPQAYENTQFTDVLRDLREEMRQLRKGI